MTRSYARNAINDPQMAADIRAAISGKPVLKEAKPRKSKRPKCMVSQYHSYDPRKDAHTIQLPIAFDRNMYNAGRVPFYMRERYVTQMRDAVWMACAAYLQDFDATRVRRIEFVRIAVNRLDDDNIIAAFKAIRDALCARLVWGDAASSHIRAIGTADDKLAKAGVTWTYRQQKCESNPRLYGIRIILHCAPPSTEQ